MAAATTSSLAAASRRSAFTLDKPDLNESLYQSGAGKQQKNLISEHTLHKSPQSFYLKKNNNFSICNSNKGGGKYLRQPQELKYQLHDLVWAKLNNFPWWPCKIINDVNNQFTKNIGKSNLALILALICLLNFLFFKTTFKCTLFSCLVRWKKKPGCVRIVCLNTEGSNRSRPMRRIRWTGRRASRPKKSLPNASSSRWHSTNATSGSRRSSRPICFSRRLLTPATNPTQTFAIKS